MAYSWENLGKQDEKHGHFTKKTKHRFFWGFMEFRCISLADLSDSSIDAHKLVYGGDN